MTAETAAPPGWVTPASFGQERLWVACSLDPGSPVYHVAGLVPLPATVDAETVRDALAAVVARHETLRTALRVVDGVLHQVVLPDVPLDLPVVDLSGLPGPERHAALERRYAALATAPIPLESAPLWRAELVEVGPDGWRLVFIAHHTVFDATSHVNLRAELTELCAAAAEGRPARLPELSIQYADYAAWQRTAWSGDTAAADLAFWRDRLADLPRVHALPTDRPRPATPGYAGAEIRFPLPAAVTAALGPAARAAGATPFMVLLAAFSALLTRLSGEPDVVVGVPVAGRDAEQVAPLIGMFVNTLVLRVDAGGDPSFAELVGRVREVQLGALEHRGVPFQALVEDLAPRRDPALPPLYQIGFNYIPQAGIDASFGTAREDLLLELSDTEGRLEYATDLFDAATARAMIDRYLHLLAAALAAPGTPVPDLPLLDAEGSVRALAAGVGARVDVPPATVHGLVAARAAAAPDAVAVVAEDATLTAAELDARAARVARALRARGVGRGAVVGVCVERSAALVVALLGILKAGAAYLPLDPDHPPRRLADTVADAGCAAVLAGPGLAGRTGDAVPVLLLDEAAAETDVVGAGAVGTEAAGADVAGPDDAAYVIYTSGSTGRPKGVVNAHRGVVNRLDWAQRTYGLTPDDVVLQKTPATFDVSVWEFFWPLIAGARLVVVRPGGHRDPAHLRALIAAEGVTTVHFVPSMLSAFLLAAAGEGPVPGCGSLRRVLCSGEELSPAVASACLRALPGAALHNLYGPTEAAVDVSAWPVRPGPGDTVDAVPLGLPVQNTTLYVLDARLRPVPPGVAGELHIGGVQVARGYLGRPGATAERFVPDPFGPPGARLYRTGDRARWAPDGTLRYLGRLDDQVKIRGMRVEPAEVEAVLRAQRGVLDAAVVVRGEGADARLVGYVVGGPGPGPLRAACRDVLPEHMVPAVVTALPALPVTANGKLDRAALPDPVAAPRDDAAPFVAPRTPGEELVAEAWAAVLGVERVGVHDDFFELGGHSLLGMRALARLRAATGVEPSIGTLFAEPTVAGFARALDALLAGRDAGADPIGRRWDGVSPVPLSYGQERLWFLHRFDPGDTSYNVPVVRRLRGPLDVDALTRGLAEVVARHAPLRAGFPDVDGRPSQVVAPAVPVGLSRDDLGTPPGAPADAEAERRAAEWVAARVAEPFDLAVPPLLRVALLRVADDDAVLCVVMHHIVSDGWSMNLLVDELAVGYGAAVRGEPSPLPPLPVTYPDHTLWQRSRLDDDPVAQAGLAHWTARLADAPVLTLPTDRPRPAVRTTAGEMVTRLVPGDVGQRVEALARDSSCTLFMVLLAAYQVLLGRHAGQDDVCVGAPIAGRDRAEVEPLIGYFLNTLVLRGDLSGDPTFREMLARTRADAVAAYAHQDVPFERLMTDLRVERDLSRTALFQAVFTLHSQGATGTPFPGLAAERFADGAHEAKSDLTLEAWRESGGALHLQLVYGTDLFARETAERLLARLDALLAEVAADPDRPLSRLAAPTPAERAELAAWGAGAPADDGSRADDSDTVLAAVARQVAATPDADAVVLGDRRLSYAGLDAAADALAAVLRARGVGRETVVGVCVPRSPATIVALLAVWRAGGAYLPLDPDLPAARQAYLLADAGAALVVAGVGVADRLPAGVPVVAVDPDGRAPADHPVATGAAGGGSAPVAGRTAPADVLPAQVAYVVHTSGSTGQPKGVAVPHGALAARVRWMRAAYGLGPADRVLQFASLGFDTSAEEIWPALTSGAAVVLMPGSGVLLPDVLRTPAGRGLTVLDLPTSYWHELVADVDRHPWPPALRLVILGADQVSPVAVAAWRKVFGDRVPLVNTYGPTETTIVATAAPLGEADAHRRPPIGGPIGQTRVAVVDDALAPVPVGVPGELRIGGVGVARGYLGRPGATAERFRPDPDGPPGARCYLTGDRVRWRPDGVLEFLGRADTQVKVRGYRIEPGEVEACLLAHPAVGGAAVVPAGADGAVRLVAYVVPASGATVPAADALTRHAAATLPAYMVPASFVVLDRLPLTVNGKLDRRALPAPGDEAAGASAAPPSTTAEEIVAEVWEHVLGRDGIGAGDDFFALGGHSLLATRVAVRLGAELDLEVPVAALFAHPTVAALAAEVERLLAAEIDEMSDDEAERLLADGSRR